MAPADIELDLERVAELARLAPGDEERESLRRDVVAILRKFSAIAESGAGAPPAAGTSGPRNALRDDLGPVPFDGATEIAAQAPRSADGLVLVPKSL